MIAISVKLSWKAIHKVMHSENVPHFRQGFLVQFLLIFVLGNSPTTIAIMTTIAKYFLQGLLYITPITVTIYALYWMFTELDQLLTFAYPGVGILVLMVMITVVGFIGSYLIQLPLFSFLDNTLEKVPLIKTIYTSVKDMLKALVGQKQGFNRPVLVKVMENSEMRRIGFVTDEGLRLLEGEEPFITVYLPFSISVSGQLYLVPTHYLTPLQGKPAEIMKYVVAGGVTSLSENEQADVT